ncbi:MAG: protein-L-isoaspartate(D-aspartate) O-methyltransferase [Myxococcota bacterium]|nr:protein-L-isoaspartate(D-aspartate) O-methyltransferase [Myxococcota bacterium]
MTSANHHAGLAGYVRARSRLVSKLAQGGISDARVLAAMNDTPRHALIPEILRVQAYRDQALPIGEGQTISAPGVVARMTQALNLKGKERILEIGTGSGYQAAVLSHLVESVISIERIPHLAATARGNLDRMGISNVAIFLGDGTRGRAENGPYDGILVTAGGPAPPEPVLLQLRIGGALIGPFGPRDQQQLLRIVRRNRTHFVQEVLGGCSFVDLIGEHGWAA